MRDWLTIQCKKEEDPHLRRFIQNNPLLDYTMKTLLGKQLKLSEPSLQKWIEACKNGTSEWWQSDIQNGGYHAKNHDCLQLLMFRCK